ncbi:MAG: ABC transporter permease [Bacteroidota bacterium]
MKRFPDVFLKIKIPRNQVWNAMKKDKVIVSVAWFIILLFILATFSYQVIPDGTRFANRKCIPIGNQPPGFEVMMLKVMGNKPEESQGLFSRIVYGESFNNLYIPISSSHYEGTDIVVKEFSASGDSSFESRYNVADVVYTMNKQKKIIERNGGLFFENADGVQIEESISDIHAIIDGQYLFKKKFILGTDLFGRDVLSRLLAASKATLWTAFFASMIACFIGFLSGLIAGILKGKLKTFVVWILQSISTVPAFISIAGILFIVGHGFLKVSLVCGLVLSTEVARVIISKITAIREKKFVESAYALGLTKREILKNHILPGIFRPLAASFAAIFCASILLESALSFLGVGLQEPVPSWGTMIRENFGYIIVPGYAYMTILPGLAIFIISIAFVVLANRYHQIIKEKYSWSII